RLERCGACGVHGIEDLVDAVKYQVCVDLSAERMESRELRRDVLYGPHYPLRQQLGDGRAVYADLLEIGPARGRDGRIGQRGDSQLQVSDQEVRDAADSVVGDGRGIGESLGQGKS